MIKEAVDDIARHKRDKDLNNKRYDVFKRGAWTPTNSKDLRVGNLIRVNQNERVPADMLLLYTTEASGAVFIRTD